MSKINAGEIDEFEAIELARSGGVLLCPVCKADLITIPEVGEKVFGLQCPVSSRHFFVYAEDPDAMRQMRIRMKLILENESKSRIGQEK